MLDFARLIYKLLKRPASQLGTPLSLSTQVSVRLPTSANYLLARVLRELRRLLALEAVAPEADGADEKVKSAQPLDLMES